MSYIHSLLRIVTFGLFFGRNGKTIDCFRDLLTFNHLILEVLAILEIMNTKYLAIILNRDDEKTLMYNSLTIMIIIKWFKLKFCDM